MPECPVDGKVMTMSLDLVPSSLSNLRFNLRRQWPHEIARDFRIEHPDDAVDSTDLTTERSRLLYPSCILSNLYGIAFGCPSSPTKMLPLLLPILEDACW